MVLNSLLARNLNSQGNKFMNFREILNSVNNSEVAVFCFLSAIEARPVERLNSMGSSTER